MFRFLRPIALIVLVMVFPLQGLSAATGDSQSLWTMIRDGGWAMWPLGLCSLAMFFLIFHGTRETKRTRFIPQDTLESLSRELAARRLAEARELLKSGDTLLARTLDRALRKAQPNLPDAGKAKVEAAMLEALEAEEGKLAQWINYLNVIASTAPMIGLLGTVSGMIGAFQTMKAVGMGQPQAFAGSIGEALITTAAGLVIGIPAMVAYFVLKNRLASAMSETAQVATDLIDDLAGEAAPPSAD